MNRILIVDDEAMLRETVAAILSGDDCAVDTAQDGAEALRLLDLHRYELVLSDLRMPGLLGIQPLHGTEDKFPVAWLDHNPLAIRQVVFDSQGFPSVGPVDPDGERRHGR